MTVLAAHPLEDPDVPLAVHAAVLESQLAADRRYHLAFPGATDIQYPDLAKLLSTQLLNNVGDPWVPGHGRDHTKAHEIHVIQQLGELFGAGPDVWGYVTPGATEGTVHALYDARLREPDVMVYASTEAHYSAAKAAALVGLPLTHIPVDGQGRMSLDHLRAELSSRARQPAAIVATVGTTTREAVDDVAAIAGLCGELGIRRRIHVDAALAGIPLALRAGQPAFGFAAGATSMVISGHKFLSTGMPCGVVLYRIAPHATRADVSYIGAPDTTICGSRSGHTPLLLHWSLTTGGGWDGHRRRAEQARTLAAYAYERLREIGWPADWSHPAFTISLDVPAQALRRPWVLGEEPGRRGRIICMPGMQQAWIDEFLTDLTALRRGRVIIPAPRRPGSVQFREASS
jgi:histidine decarboxylase